MRVLDGANTWSLIRPGHESSTRSAQLIRRWGLLRESARGKRKRQGTVSRVGRWTTRAFKQTHFFFVIYYMLSSGSFVAACLQAITKGVLDPRLPWADTCSVSGLDKTSTYTTH
jgi:hypothetical protein